MTNLFWMPLNIGQEMAETQHLTLEEIGAFHRLQMHFWQHGSLPVDETRLMRIVGATAEQWPGLRDAIRPLFGDDWHHERLAAERRRAEQTHQKKVGAGRRGAEARWGENSSANSSANGKRNGSANGSANAGANGSAYGNKHLDEELSHEEVAPTHASTHGQAHTRARGPIPKSATKLEAGQWLSFACDLFPGDPSFDGLAQKKVAGTLTWGDIEAACQPA